MFGFFQASYATVPGLMVILDWRMWLKSRGKMRRQNSPDTIRDSDWNRRHTRHFRLLSLSNIFILNVQEELELFSVYSIINSVFVTKRYSKELFQKF